MDEQHVLDVANAHAGNDGGVVILFIVIAFVIVVAAILMKDKTNTTKLRRNLEEKDFYANPANSGVPGNIYYHDK